MLFLRWRSYAVSRRSLTAKAYVLDRGTPVNVQIISYIVKSQHRALDLFTLPTRFIRIVRLSG